MKKKILALFLGISFMLSACGTGLFAAPTATPTLTPIPPTATPVPPTATIAPSPTATITPSPTPFLVLQGPDKVFIPIFLYHRVEPSPTNNEYYVDPRKFEAQIKLLSDWGYTTISMDMLVQAITQGASLPPRPMLITFDDGHLDNYETVFPIMQRYGFKGVLYIVANYMGADGYMNADQIKEMAAAGWEVGSHSITHSDLTKLDAERQRYEVVASRTILQNALNLPIKSFAYPFGIANSSVIDYVHFAEYTSAVGLGYTYDQGSSNLFNLQRRDIKGYYTMQEFADLLPWKGDPASIPADPPTSTPAP